MDANQGVAEKARLTQAYMQASLQLYRETRAEARRLLAQVVEAGYESVQIAGDGDLAEICLLTCLEQRVMVRQEADPTQIPTLMVEGRNLAIHWSYASEGEAGFN